MKANCLAACACSDGGTFIIDSHRNKSTNRHSNKAASQQRANKGNGISKRVTTNSLKDLWRKRELQIDGYFGWMAGDIARRRVELRPAP